MDTLSPQDQAKKVAGAKAIELYLQDGLKIGLGSGTTSRWFVRILGERVKQGLKVTGVPTSNSTKELATEMGIPLADLNEVQRLDLAIDGADEIDAQGRMIKGGGGNLLWEKIVASASTRMVAIVDETKVVRKLGRFPLAVEIIPFGWRSTELHLRRLLGDFGWHDPRIEMRGGLDNPYLTDSGHFLLDCHLEEISDPDPLAQQLNQIAGVVEHGLFIGIAREGVIGRADGSAERLTF